MKYEIISQGVPIVGAIWPFNPICPSVNGICPGVNGVCPGIDEICPGPMPDTLCDLGFDSSCDTLLNRCHNPNSPLQCNSYSPAQGSL